jgi:uncharacterized membrane protein YkoI
MTWCKWIIAGTLLGAALQALALQAQAADPSPAPLWGYLSVVPPTETAADVSAFAGSRLSIVQAIDEAGKAHNGCVIEIGFVRWHDTLSYAATLGAPDGLHYVHVDPRTGAVSKGDRKDVPRDELDPQGLRDLATIGSAEIGLAQAVNSAEKVTGGRAIAAGVEQLGGIPQYYVQTVNKRKLDAVIVDPRTGHAARPLQ